MSLNRRQVFSRSAVTAGVVAATVGLDTVAGAGVASAAPARSGFRAGDPAKLFGPLHHSRGDLLALPKGFSYEVISVAGKTDVHDGTGKVVGKTPERPDGTGVVSTQTGYRLLQNHEIYNGSDAPVPTVPGTVYDRGLGAVGGVTVIETDRTGRRVSEWVGLSGTLGNCAGGITPWGTWLTCEENEIRPGTLGAEQDHGFVFEVFPDVPARQVPQPIRAWGRYAHEAAVVAPDRRTVHLTEDAAGPNGLLYRWSAPSGYRLKPNIAGMLSPNAGTLEAMAVLSPDGSVVPDLSYATSDQIGRPFRVRWINVPDRHAKTASVRTQFRDGQITRSRKIEGAWGDANGMYFACSFAFEGDVPKDATTHDGQIWYLDYARQTVTLVLYFPYTAAVHDEQVNPETGLGYRLDLAYDGPDNVHVTPYGGLVLAEDGSSANHLLSWNTEFGVQPVARNLIVANAGHPEGGPDEFSEMTGPSFTADGSILFGNVQVPGHVFAIRGPWSRHLG